jgi:hypothetical protein
MAHELRGRFFWRVGVLFALLLALACGGAALLAALTLDFPSVVHTRPGAFISARPFGAVAFVLIVIGFLLAGRALRRTATPIGDVIEAAGRVAEGDYSARVPDRAKCAPWRAPLTR